MAEAGSAAASSGDAAGSAAAKPQLVKEHVPALAALFEKAGLDKEQAEVEAHKVVDRGMTQEELMEALVQTQDAVLKKEKAAELARRRAERKSATLSAPAPAPAPPAAQPDDAGGGTVAKYRPAATGRAAELGIDPFEALRSEVEQQHERLIAMARENRHEFQRDIESIDNLLQDDKKYLAGSMLEVKNVMRDLKDELNDRPQLKDKLRNIAQYHYSLRQNQLAMEEQLAKLDQTDVESHKKLLMSINQVKGLDSTIGGMAQQLLQTQRTVQELSDFKEQASQKYVVDGIAQSAEMQKIKAQLADFEAKLARIDAHAAQVASHRPPKAADQTSSDEQEEWV
mmetsp:Transcript_74627/g.209422  ORF Transcript_74627/g.209422 Transcript_74627/m.209422 type:complete len:341 (+) Transcript_74627:139-1161(+)